MVASWAFLLRPKSGGQALGSRRTVGCDGLRSAELLAGVRGVMLALPSAHMLGKHVG